MGGVGLVLVTGKPRPIPSVKVAVIITIIGVMRSIPSTGQAVLRRRKGACHQSRGRHALTERGEGWRIAAALATVSHREKSIPSIERPDKPLTFSDKTGLSANPVLH